MTERKARRRESSTSTQPAPDDRPLLPHNLEAERCVLGAIMIDNSQFDLLAPWVDDGFFYRDAHSRIWEAMNTLAEAGKAIDLVTLKDEVARTGDLDAVGGPAYMASLTDGIPHATNVDYYADILKDLKIKRRLVHYARRIMEGARAGEQTGLEILANADAALLSMTGSHETSRLLTIEEAANRHFATLEWRAAHRGELIGLETGFPQVNDVTLGWQRGDLIIIAARPSIGKTAFTMNSVVAAAKRGHRSLICSLEMKTTQLMDRLIGAESNVPVTRLLNGYVAGSQDEMTRTSTALSLLATLPMQIDDTTRRTTDNIRRACRRAKMAGQPIDALVIDYIQLMSATKDQRLMNRSQQLGDISRRLKELADEFNMAVLALSQLSRKGQERFDPKPIMSDLRESGDLEQNADVIGFLHRSDHKKGGPTEFILEKQRMGPCGTVMLNFDRDITRFDDAPDIPIPEPPQEASRPRRRPKVPVPPGF